MIEGQSTRLGAVWKEDINIAGVGVVIGIVVAEIVKGRGVTTGISREVEIAIYIGLEIGSGLAGVKIVIYIGLEIGSCLEIGSGLAGVKIGILIGLEIEAGLAGVKIVIYIGLEIGLLLCGSRS